MIDRQARKRVANDFVVFLLSLAHCRFLVISVLGLRRDQRALALKINIYRKVGNQRKKRVRERDAR